jgi:hypothetical protein
MKFFISMSEPHVENRPRLTLVAYANIKSPNVAKLRTDMPAQINRLQSLDRLKEVNNHTVMSPRVVAVAIMNAKMIHGFGPINEGKILN